MFELVKYGRLNEDPSFYFREFAADTGCDLYDRDQWAKANPALGDFLTSDGLMSVAKTMREAAFRRYRLGQWVGTNDAWLPFGVWDTLAVDRNLKDGEKVVLGFDGSASGDSTALVAVTLDFHVVPLNIWVNPGEPGWRVPRMEVTDAIADAFDRYDVVELAADPWGWRSELEEWAKEYGDRRVTEWNTGFRQRMGPAADRVYAAVMERKMTHNGDPMLAEHVRNTVAQQTAVGALVQKDKKNSPRKIDATVAMIAAFDRAAWHGRKRTRKAVSF